MPNESSSCEICKDTDFVRIFCRNIGGDAECQEMSERAATGELSQEEYFQWIIDKFGAEKADDAFEKTTLAIQSGVARDVLTPRPSNIVQRARGGSFARSSSGIVPPVQPVQQPGERPAGEQPAREQPAGEQPAREQPPTEPSLLDMSRSSEPPAAVDTAGTQETAKELVLAGTGKYRSSIKGVCLPCVGMSWAAILTATAEWFTGDDKRKFADNVDAINAGRKTVEEALADVLCISGAKAGLNVVLTDMNKVMDLGVEDALKKRPDMAEEIKAD